MSKRILIIIPCFNEEKALPNVLLELKAFTAFNIDVIVINDCSRDDTANVPKQYNVPVLDLPINLGIGGAMQTGYRYAFEQNYDIAIQLDGDGQHLPSELPKLIQHHLDHGDNVVIGSRFKEKTAYVSAAGRRIGIYYFHLLNKLLTGNSIYDCTSGFRLFDRKAIAIAAFNYPDEYPEPESLILFSSKGLSVVEVPVLMQARQGGHSSIRYMATVYYMVKVSMAMFFSFLRYSKK